MRALELLKPDSADTTANRQPIYRSMKSAMVAAAQQMSRERGDQAPAKGGEKWQKEAWDYYDSVGELHYADSFISSCARRVKLRIALRDKKNNVTAAWDDEGAPLHDQAEEANDWLRRLVPSIGGHGELLSVLTGNLNIAGEAYLVGELFDGEAEPSSWNILSVEELVEESGKYMKVSTTNQKVELRTIETPIRIWKAHKRHTQKADSSVRPVLDVLEEIVLLTKAVRGTTLSRLTGAGILAIPEEIEIPPAKDADPDDDVDQFTVDLIHHLTTPIQDKGSAASVVPFIFRAPGDRIEQIKHFDFTRSFDSYPSVALRSEAIQRLAQGLDLPVEIITGQGGTNHWSAWQIDESTFKAHIEPLLEIMVDAFTDWLQNRMPELTINGDGYEVIVHYDATELVSHPNESADMKDAYDRRVISASRYREAIGASDGDAPDEEELQQRLDWEKATRTPGAPGSVVDGAENVEQGPPAEGEGSASHKIRMDALAEVTHAGIEVAVERAVERFGARVRSKHNGTAGIRNAIDGVDNRLVAMTLGPQRIQSMWKPHELFPDEFRSLRRVMLNVARTQGHPDPELWATSAVKYAERLAQKRLYDPEAKLEELTP